ncbi:MAG: phenylalanine--tRNA ligase subunit beta [Anaerolineales bacterium]|nr:phenylalanine--tRNA ligase subunit beta [Anaerolineales bacterium]
MKFPLSWLKDYVDITLPINDLAYQLTIAGLEVEAIHFVGLPLPQNDKLQYKVSGFAWERDKIVVAAIHEVMPHPNADRLTLCKLDDGEQIHTVLTGAPNLFDYKGIGELNPPLKVAYAREGAQLYDGHQPGYVLTRLKRTKIRGVDSYSMVCSEKELGISDEHEGIMFLPADAPTGMPLADYLGDAVLDIAITPNIARDTNMLGVAREIAAITKQPLRQPSFDILAEGPSIEGRVSITIPTPEINPRFVLGLIENVEIKPSPEWVQRRLRLAGQRPINNIVDVTNYAMLDVGEPLHAFDYDVLVKRAQNHAERSTLSGGFAKSKGAGQANTPPAPHIHTRLAEKGEKLKTLDNVERTLDEFTVLVCDDAGPLALAGVMGGQESEVTDETKTVLLEGAAWNMINTRRTVISQKLPSEAAYRFSRGIHPALAERGVRRGLELMRQWSGGTVAAGLVDTYPLPPEDPTIAITPADVKRWLGITLSAEEIVRILESLEFTCTITQSPNHPITIKVTTPDHRLDIGTGVIGQADLMEEIARIYGYQNIPETRMADEIPPQRGNPTLEVDERVRDILARAGLREAITYRVTTPEAEARRLVPGTPPTDKPYMRLANVINQERTVMRQSLLASVLEIVERNARIRERIALFEIGEVFLSSEGGELPDELPRVVIALTGPRASVAWQGSDPTPMDFYDLKGVVEALLDGLHIPVKYEPAAHPSLHPGKTAHILAGEKRLGVMGELHPEVAAQYDLPETPVLVAELNMDVIYDLIPARYETVPVPLYPPIVEDLALVMNDDVPAAQVEFLIRQTGGATLADVTLFDVYRGDKLGTGRKSLAYHLTYLAPDKTLTDKDVAKVRYRIVQRLERELGAQLRS